MLSVLCLRLCFCLTAVILFQLCNVSLKGGAITGLRAQNDGQLEDFSCRFNEDKASVDKRGRNKWFYCNRKWPVSLNNTSVRSQKRHYSARMTLCTPACEPPVEASAISHTHLRVPLLVQTVRHHRQRSGMGILLLQSAPATVE